MRNKACRVSGKCVRYPSNWSSTLSRLKLTVIAESLVDPAGPSSDALMWGHSGVRFHYYAGSICLASPPRACAKSKCIVTLCTDSLYNSGHNAVKTFKAILSLWKRNTELPGCTTNSTLDKELGERTALLSFKPT